MTLNRSLLASVLALLLGVAVVSGVTSGTVLSLFNQAIVYAVFALGIGVLLKQNGMVSFGHALYFGSAGYLLGILLQLQLASAETIIVLTLLIITVTGFVFGLVIVRVPGVAFGMLTLAIGQMFYLTASRARGFTGGADGMNIDWPSTLFGMPVSQILKPGTMFLVSWTTLVIVMFLVACSPNNEPVKIAEPQRKALEKAKEVAVSEEQISEETKKAIEEQTQ
jgi:branched-chain amino acid transport system permease protein